jgi:hypothetical protein
MPSAAPGTNFFMSEPGPANPVPEGVEAPTPPGGPQRQDAADTDEVPGRPTGKQAGTDPTPRSVQEENAATSLDQPSDNSGGE